MHTQRIFWRIFRSNLAVTLLTALVLFFVFSGVLTRFHHRQTLQSLEAYALLAAERFAEGFGDRRTGVRFDPLLDRFGKPAPLRITLVLPDGTVTADSDGDRRKMDNHRNRPEIMTALAGSMGVSERHSDTLRTPMMYVAAPVLKNGNIAGAVRVSMPLAEIRQMIRPVRLTVIGGGLLILLLAAGLSLFVSRRISRPLERIREGAERFAGGDFSCRLHTAGSAETKMLAETMNTMAGQLEERLQTLIRERNEREAVLSSMVEGVLAVDTGGHIISMNQAAARFFHVMEPGGAAGRTIEEVFRNVRLQRFIHEVLETRDARECEIEVQNDGITFLQACGTGLLGIHRRRIGAVVVFNDVTRLRRLEAVRRDFVANVSHELKTPITSIKGFVETLIDGAAVEPAEAGRFLNIIAKHADRLNAIIDDLLMLSRLEQDGREEMEMQTCGLSGILKSAAEVCSRRAAQKNMTLHVDCPETVSARVNPPLIEQALVNLIGNAVKYSPDGRTVNIRARTETGQVVLSVQDEGFGIEEKHLDRLWERFYRVDKGRSRQEGGTGLGLSIVKHIAQIHGGRAAVKSRFGEGSVFSIILPAA